MHLYCKRLANPRSQKKHKSPPDCSRMCLHGLRHFILLDDGLDFYTFSFKLAFDFRECTLCVVVYHKRL